MLLAVISPGVAAHATGENYVWLNRQADHLEGRFQVRLADLRAKLGLSLPEELEAAETRVKETDAQVQAYLREHFSIRLDGRDVPIEFTGTMLVKARKLGHFAEYQFRSAPMKVPDRLSVRNTLFFQDDPFHRSLLLVKYDELAGKQYGAEFAALVFSPANDEQVLDFTDIRGLLPNGAFVWQGMLHIWIGIDHVLFLVALLIPAVLVRRDADWHPAEGFRTVFWNVLKMVTVFTIAHSITLALAALEIVQLPSRLVESVIALSIILVALNNIFPRYREGTLLIIFAFGLFHGLGFASVMGELPFRMQDLVWVLVAFNVGVEIGQVAIVLVVVPLIFALRNRSFYRELVPVYGSACLAVIAAYWFMERALGLGV
ncbi:MAG: HupE/UreJ family protein [Gammaproteobacteria bacterium]|nr:HupE/UreJ family protein [Gammaproteobacteria bacterium]